MEVADYFPVLVIVLRRGWWWWQGEGVGSEFFQDLSEKGLTTYSLIR